MERLKTTNQFIIYGAGARGRFYYDFLKFKKLNNRVYGFCDKNAKNIRMCEGLDCYTVEEIIDLKIPFLIAIEDKDIVSELHIEFERLGIGVFTIDDIANYLEIDKVAFNRDYIAFYHEKQMDSYYLEAEEDDNIGIFWGEKSAFFSMFKQLDLREAIELACGKGRHLVHYVEDADRVTLVDILESNIDFCQERFKEYEKISYYCNNGFNVERLPSNKYTALFSYDAVVHFEMMDIYEYLKDIHRVLVKGGKVLIHHSNYDKDYQASFINSPHGRSFINKNIFAYLASRVGFNVVEQRVISWANIDDMDCITLLERK